jgi:hypothetical protein
MGHGGGVSYTDRTPTTPTEWRIEAFPADWDPDNPAPIKAVRVDNGTTDVLLPERLYLVFQSETMRRLSEPTAVVAELEADKSGVTVVRIFGTGENWLSDVESVATQFPTERWVVEAVKRAVEFMIDREVLADLGPLIKDLSIPRRDQVIAMSEAGGAGSVQRRRQITPEHLADVATTYLLAQERGAPPTRAVQEEFEVSHSTAAKWVGKARNMGLLPPANQED